MSEVRTIILCHKRNPELVDDRHLYTGYIDLQDSSGSPALSRFDFVSLPFHKVMTRISQHLREYPDAAVVLHRLEREGLQPIQLSEDLRLLLRDDPVRAIWLMDEHSGREVRPDVRASLNLIRSDYDTLADAFGERVYIRMRHGAAEDPVTGRWKTLAYGPKCGWRIRGEKDSYGSWLPIQLEGIDIPVVKEDANMEEVQLAMEDFATVLAECKWGSIAVKDLLDQPGHKFFLPRRWNTEAQWIGRQALQERLDTYLEERKEAQS